MPEPRKAPRIVWKGDRFVVLGASGEEITRDVDELMLLDAQVRATVSTVAGLAERLTELTDKLARTIESVDEAARCHATFANDIDRLAKVLMLPTVPVYDAQGRVIGARRVEKLEAENEPRTAKA